MMGYFIQKQQINISVAVLLVNLRRLLIIYYFRFEILAKLHSRFREKLFASSELSFLQKI